MNRETEIHRDFCAWLDKHGYGYVHCRTYRKSTVQIGIPDFVVCKDNRCLFIEIKRIGAKCSPAQISRAHWLEAAGNTVEVAYSLPECIFAVTTLLGRDSGHPGARTGHSYTVSSTTSNYGSVTAISTI